MTIGPPPATIELLGKLYYPAETMNPHLHLLRAELARSQHDLAIMRQDRDHQKSLVAQLTATR